MMRCVHTRDSHREKSCLAAFSLALAAFSLMNDIKTPERSSMNQQLLSNLMLWHVTARQIEADGSRSSKHIACRDVPVMEILKEFRAIAKEEYRRRPHRPADKPTYEYEKHRIKVE